MLGPSGALFWSLLTKNGWWGTPPTRLHNSLRMSLAALAAIKSAPALPVLGKTEGYPTTPWMTKLWP
jgi:hypothetical protein